MLSRKPLKARTAVRLHVFKPEGSIQDVDAAGQAIFKAS